jgi:hypothetical protein
MDAVAIALPLTDDRDFLIKDTVGAGGVCGDQKDEDVAGADLRLNVRIQSAPTGMSGSIHTVYLRPFSPGRKKSMTKLSQRTSPGAGFAGSSRCA